MMMFSDSLSIFPSLGFILLGWVFSGGMYFICVPIELGRARTVISELKELVTNRVA